MSKSSIFSNRITNVSLDHNHSTISTISTHNENSPTDNMKDNLQSVIEQSAIFSEYDVSDSISSNTEVDSASKLNLLQREAAQSQMDLCQAIDAESNTSSALNNFIVSNRNEKFSKELDKSGDHSYQNKNISNVQSTKCNVPPLQDDISLKCKADDLKTKQAFTELLQGGTHDNKEQYQESFLPGISKNTELTSCTIDKNTKFLSPESSIITLDNDSEICSDVKKLTSQLNICKSKAVNGNSNKLDNLINTGKEKHSSFLSQEDLHKISVVNDPVSDIESSIGSSPSENSTDSSSSESSTDSSPVASESNSLQEVEASISATENSSSSSFGSSINEINEESQNKENLSKSQDHFLTSSDSSLPSQISNSEACAYQENDNDNDLEHGEENTSKSSLKEENINNLVSKYEAVVTTESEMDVLITESEMNVVTTESEMNVVTAESEMNVVPAESEMDVVTTESDMNVVTTESEMDVVTTESEMNVITTESIMNVITTESIIKVFKEEKARTFDSDDKSNKQIITDTEECRDKVSMSAKNSIDCCEGFELIKDKNPTLNHDKKLVEDSHSTTNKVSEMSNILEDTDARSKIFIHVSQREDVKETRSSSPSTDSDCDMFEDYDDKTKNNDDDHVDLDLGNVQGSQVILREDTTPNDDEKIGFINIPPVNTNGIKKICHETKHMQVENKSCNTDVKSSDNSLKVEGSCDSGIVTVEFANDESSERDQKEISVTQDMKENNLQSGTIEVSCAITKENVDLISHIKVNVDSGSVVLQKDGSTLHDESKNIDCDKNNINVLDNSLSNNKSESSNMYIENESVIDPVNDVDMVDTMAASIELKDDDKLNITQSNFYKKCDIPKEPSSSDANKEIESNNTISAVKFGLRECKVNLSQSKVSDSIILNASQDLLLDKPNFCKLKRKFEMILETAEKEKEESYKQFKKMREEKSQLHKDLVQVIKKVKNKYQL